MDRSTLDLIRELDSESSKFWLCAIVVGFESSTIFVFGNQNDRLDLLNRAIERGGEPMGMIGIIKQEESSTKGSFTLCERVYEEHADEEWSVKYMQGLLREFADLVRIRGLGTGIFEHGEWIN